MSSKFNNRNNQNQQQNQKQNKKNNNFNNQKTTKTIFKKKYGIAENLQCRVFFIFSEFQDLRL